MLHASVPAPVAHVRIVAPVEEHAEIDGHPAILPFVFLNKQQYSEYRRRLWQRNPNCTYCHKKITWANTTLDHLQPKSKGGVDTPSNLVLACERCNQAKDSRSLVEWAADIAQVCNDFGQTMEGVATC